MGCRACGSNSRRGKYCVDCGERTAPKPYTSIIVFSSIAILVLLATVRLLVAHEEPKPTELNLLVVEPEGCTAPATVFVQLAAASPLKDATVSLSVNGKLLEQLQTDQNGRFFTVVTADWCSDDVNITASFPGDRWHEAVNATKSVRRTISCSAGLIPVDGACVPREQRASTLIARLQRSIVKIQHPDSRGSGVIIDHSSESTYILTNKHVIAEAGNPYSVKILTSENKQLFAKSIYIAPHDMDLAIIEVKGVHGTPAMIESSEYVQGDDVVALGSPHGIQGSVSKGIISNFGTEKTTQKYVYKTVQTDAAINKGNSGGGLFHESTGNLIGINSFKMKNAEGMNFAIDISEYTKLPHFKEWQQW